MQWDLQPTYDDTAVLYRPVILRMHLVESDQGVEVLPGTSVRVLGLYDDPHAPTVERAKDLWVIGASDRVRTARRRPLPQVDLVASVPTRAAEALFCAGRALERTELLARTLHVVLDRTGGTADTQMAERWVAPAIGMLGHVAGLDLNRASATTTHGSEAFIPSASLASAATALASQLGSLLAEVSSVREFYSVTAGRLFVRLTDQRRDISALVSATVPSRSITDGFDALASDLVAILRLASSIAVSSTVF